VTNEPTTAHISSCMIRKTCRKCHVSKDAADFGIDRSKSDGLKSYCRDCARKYAQQRRHDSKSEHYLRQYGITEPEFERLLSEANNECQLCDKKLTRNRGSSDAAVLDHCHVTQRIRGVLCNSCNMLLGRLEKQPLLISRIQRYLESP